MVLEQLLASRWVEKRLSIVFLFGFIFVFFSYFASKIFFFSYDVSISIIFLLVIMLVPSLNRILELEEKIEAKQGLRHFFHNHRNILEIYFFLFLGIFSAFLILGHISQSFTDIFRYQMQFLQQQEGLNKQLIDNFLNRPFTPDFSNFIGILVNNASVMLLCFVLSLFYGAGGIYLLVLNASIFSTFILYVMDYAGRVFQKSLWILLLFFIHLIPEISGFLIAAIAGGVVSTALAKEKLGTRRFKNVFRDAAFLLLISLLVITLGAYLEVFVSAKLVYWYLG